MESNLTAPKEFMGKLNVQAMAKQYNCDHHYDGHKRIMYIVGTNAQSCINAITEKHQTAFEMEAGLEKPSLKRSEM